MGVVEVVVVNTIYDQRYVDWLFDLISQRGDDLACLLCDDYATSSPFW